MTLVVDCTTAFAYVGRPAVGIVRVEREITRYALDHTDAEFVVFNRNQGDYKFLPRDLVREILKSVEGAGEDLPPVWRLDTFKFRCFHFLLIAGLPWDNNQLLAVYQKKQRHKFRLGVVLYDIIPVVMPEYCVPEMNTKFTRFVLDLAHTADEVFCISEYTEKDFRAFLEKLGLSAPKTHIFQLGSDTWDEDTASAGAANFLPDNPEGYVAYISSIEPRKNHALLFNIWRELHKERGDRMPTMLCVGKQQWNVENFMVSVGLSDVFRKGLFQIIQNLSDTELATVYSNAKFTVYPSLYEGWGLPIVESMTCGKPVLISNRSSMPEAGAGLCPALDPYDYQAWKRAIVGWIDSPKSLANAAKTVEREFSFYSWETAAGTFLKGLV